MSDYSYDRPRTGPWVFLTILGVLLMAGAGGLYVFARPALGGTSEAAVAYTVSMPQEFAGLKLLTDADSKKTADDLKAQLQNDGIEITETFAEIYGDKPTPTKTIMVVGAIGDVAAPASELGEAFTAVGPDMPVTNIRDVDPGSLGGDAKCAAATVEGQAMIVCAWADAGSLAMVVLMNMGDAAASEDLFREVRAAILTRA